jgi:hypothetical protein|nr:MAG TPA: hypothetical protein [Caudoviricetes sp.]
MKYSKIKSIAKIGQYHFTFKTLWDKLPKELIKKINSQESRHYY